MKEVRLPRYPTWYNLRGLLAHLRPEESAEDRLVVDWGEVRFSDPVGLVLIASYCITEAGNGVQVEFTNLAPARYEARMRIKPICGLEDDYPWSRHNPGGRFTDLHRVRGPKQSSEYAAKAVEVMQLGDGAVRSLADYSMREILDNVHAHSWSPCQAIAASQLYEGRSEVVYAVADTGMGIPKKIRMVAGDCSAAEAIRTAAEPGFTTGKKHQGHMGLGLTVSKEVAIQTGGRFAILSEDTLVTWRGRACSEVETVGWHGTGVIGIIRTDADVTLQDVLAGITK